LSRSGYSDDYDDERMAALYRGAVASSMRGKRGQAFLREMIEALDAMPEKRLIADSLRVDGPPDPMVRWLFGACVRPGFATRVPDPADLPTWSIIYVFDFPHDCGVCALGSVGIKRGLDMSKLDPEDADAVSGAFGISEVMVREIVYMNDEAVWQSETPEQRWERMRAWAVANLHGEEVA